MAWSWINMRYKTSAKHVKVVQKVNKESVINLPVNRLSAVNLFQKPHLFPWHSERKSRQYGTVTCHSPTFIIPASPSSQIKYNLPACKISCSVMSRIVHKGGCRCTIKYFVLDYQTLYLTPTRFKQYLPAQNWIIQLELAAHKTKII